MRLQSKKSNLALLPLPIAIVFIFSLIYWLYLASFTRMEICFDSIGYQELGRLLQNHGWIAYFKTGPNREPLYPLLVAASMQIQDLTGLAYTKVVAFVCVIILFLSQILTYKILRLLNIRNGICILVLGYMALSPALNNSAFSLYSEITALPIMLGIILASFYSWEAIHQKKRLEAFLYGALLGVSLTLATLVKAVFEGISPIYLIILFICINMSPVRTGTADKKNTKALAFILCLLAATSFFYVPITGYKWLNLHYNDNFAITNRGSWALYGDSARRMEPLTIKRFAEDLAYVPGEGVCNSLFGPRECYFWSFQKADEYGTAKLNELSRQNLPPDRINATLINLSIQKALQNPFQYTLLTLVEGLKMFFWESTQVGFVDYPHWLQKIYNIKLVNNGLRLLVSLITFTAVISLWLQAFGFKRASPIIILIGALIFLYTLSFSFFTILTRYALPIAPLYLIAIGIWLDQKLAPKEIK